MAYHLSVVEIIHEINQQDTPPSPKPRTPEMSITRFTGKKYDVTDEAVTAVARKMLHREESIEVDFGDGRILRFSVDIVSPGS